ncbi:MAG: hypothetical protein DRJ42_26585 [Deltaproteobacteria bacterium]|nr:MAG: hypothetical protein DRJ42_26585 [Deltaproteobacteria bacterium]
MRDVFRTSFTYRSPGLLGPLALLGVLTALGAGCSDTPSAPGCETSSECGSGLACVDGECAPVAVDSGAPDTAPTDAGCSCMAGEVCGISGCMADCGNPAAAPCGGDDVCDFASGTCVAPDTPGILTGAGERCGTDGPTCLPGTECTLDGVCAPAPPCYSVSCTPDDSTCWGRSCLRERPAGACTPASLERMNMDDFLRGGDGGAFDLEFDDGCNAYIVTMISGPDYLRQLTPAGELTIWTGVTNLNMGEVAVLRRPGGEFGVGDELGEVALTYICCATCGCVSTDPQGVAHLDRVDAESLPMVVEATPSPGDGPWDVLQVDTGPYGLAYGRNDRLYVGNVTDQGDLVAANLMDGTTEEIHRLPGRIHATAVFDETSLLVAVEGGAVHRVHVDGDIQVPWTAVGEDVTSIVRDPFTGHVYISVASARIVEYDAHGTLIGELATPGEKGRMAYAPDGHLYYLVVGWPTRAEVMRFALPSTR